MPFKVGEHPDNNWVIPIITNYQYKISFNQGQDFNTFYTQYSFPELLGGETKGLILHINNTERAEAIEYIYNNSATNSEETVVPQNTYLSLGSDSKMGDVYFNNVTRHIQIKMDGQVTDKESFFLRRDECISWGDCNGEDSEDEEPVETDTRNWSDTSSWPSGSLPQEGDEIEIESSWNMVYDLEDSPIYKTIKINGRLTIKNDGTDRQLQAYSIYIKKGELIVGTEEERFEANMNFLLHGDRSNKDVYFSDDMFEGGNKVIANTGKLKMFGKTIDVKHTRLEQTASAGDTTITIVDTPSDWNEGDLIGIAPSGRDYTHRDARIIDSISGNQITLTEPLDYEHYGASSVDSAISGEIDIRAEVVHLTRNIKVTGSNEDRWGAHVVTAHNDESTFVNDNIVTITRKGWAHIDHVEFANCSQYDTDKASVRFADMSGLGDDDERSYVKDSAIHDGLGIGIMVTSAEDILVDNNVVWYQHIGGIWMKNSRNSTINGNIVAGMDGRYWSGEPLLDEVASFNLCNRDYDCEELTVTNNIAAGGHKIGFATIASCDSSIANYANNSAHSLEHGAFLLLNEHCPDDSYFGNFHTYKTIEQGLITYQKYSQLTVKNVHTLDCGRGLTLMIAKRTTLTYITLTDSVIMGESSELPQDETCIDIYGLWLSASTIAGKKFPELLRLNMPYEKVKTPTNWRAEVEMTNVTFKNWVSGTRQN